MMKVAILDDYQNVSLILGNFEKLKKDFLFKYLISHLKMKIAQ
jgi:hypothetical protein